MKNFGKKNFEIKSFGMKNLKVNCIMIVIVTLMLCLSGCGAKQDAEGARQAAAQGKKPADVLVLTIGDEAVYLNEMNFYALNMLSGLGVQEGIDKNSDFGEEYPTMDAAYKEQLLLQVCQSKILYQKAVEEDITLSENEKEAVEGIVDEFLKRYEASDLEAFGLDAESLHEIYTELLMIQKLESKIAETAENEEVSYGTIEKLVFLTVEIDEYGNVLRDKEGSYVYLSEEMMEEQKQKAEEACSRLAAGEMAEDLIKEYDLETTSGTLHEETGALKQTYQLEDGEVSEVLESDYAYMVVKIVELVDEAYTEKVNSYNLSSNKQLTIDEQKQTWFEEFPISDRTVVDKVWNLFTFQDFI